jgi:hypothetical protein
MTFTEIDDAKTCLAFLRWLDAQPDTGVGDERLVARFMEERRAQGQGASAGAITDEIAGQ